MNEMEPFDAWSHAVIPFKMRQVTPMERFRATTWKSKEPETIEWIEYFDPQDVFFDVGANIGIYSLYCAHCHPGMSITAFEPMPLNHYTLRKNVEMNGYFIYCLPWAIGSTKGLVSLDIPEFEVGKTGAQMRPTKGDGLIVTAARIDDLGESGPLHVKIDIDGQELEVVKGMRDTMPHIKSCLIEVSAASIQPIVSIMEAAGFTTDNRFNTMTPHSRERRTAEGIDAENIVFTR